MTVARYLRISDEDQDFKRANKTESDSIVSQRNLISDFIRKLPEYVDADIVEFCDDGWSGKNFERPAVMEMLKQVGNGQIQCIIVKDLSRFGRNYLEVGNYISRIFPFLDVRFIAINDGFDSIRPMEADRLDVSFQTLLSDLYSRDLSCKVKNALRFKAEQGKYIAAFAPYGYVKDQKDKNRIVPDPAAAENVRCIFRMAADGMTTMQIAREMNERQILTPMQYKCMNGCGRVAWHCIREDNFWTPQTVIKILRDERYTGKAVFGRQKREETGKIHQVKVSKADWITVEHAHESIVSQEEFDHAQDQLRAYMERGVVCKSKRPLKRKVRCGICGRNMMRAGGRKHPYYTCMTFLLTDAYPCPAERIPEAELLEIVQKNIQEQAKYAVDISRIWEEKQRYNSRDTDGLRKTLVTLKKSRGGLENDIRELYEKFAFGELDKERYLDLKKAALEKCGNLSKKIEELEDAIKNAGTNGKLENKFAERSSQYTELKELTDAITADVLQEIIVYPDKKLNIVWNYPDDLKNLLMDTEAYFQVWTANEAVRNALGRPCDQFTQNA